MSTVVFANWISRLLISARCLLKLAFELHQLSLEIQNVPVVKLTESANDTIFRVSAHEICDFVITPQVGHVFRHTRGIKE